MKFRLLIDRSKEEEVLVTAHEKSKLTDKIEELVPSYKGTDKIPVYGILGLTGTAEVLTPAEVSKGVLTITLMAFIAERKAQIKSTRILTFKEKQGAFTLLFFLLY